MEFALALRIAHFAVRIVMRKFCFAPCLFSVSPSSQSEYSCVVPNCVQCFIREFVEMCVVSCELMHDHAPAVMFSSCSAHMFPEFVSQTLTRQQPLAASGCHCLLAS